MTTYNRFDPAKGYTEHLFHADRVAQSAEMNELQAQAAHRLRRIADTLFADGDITEGARCTVDAQTGACALEAGGIYIAGAVHSVTAAQLTVGVAGTVVVGVYYLQRTVTAVQDPALYNPAINTAGYGEPGADRIQTTVAWGLQGDGSEGSFYPVWTIEDGVVRPREPAPTFNAVTQAIERYDRDSAGGMYVVRGMIAIQLPDADGAQAYTITAGAARVGGTYVEMPADRRLVYAAAPDTAAISSEPHASSTADLQHVTFDRWPVLAPASVRIQKAKTAAITHGSFAGAADPLPDNSVIKINTITQGATTYTGGVDYQLTAGQVDWSLGGAEPAPGSTYSVQYEYISTEGVQNQTPRGFDVSGALPGTLILVDYAYALRRIDRIVMGPDGKLDVIKGVAATWQPARPDVPAGVLALASIYQTWEPDTRRTVADQVRAVPMQTLVAYAQRMDGIELDLAELRLATDVNGRYGGLKKGYFADPMIDNSMRDQGLAQTALIDGGALQLHEAQTATLLGDGATTHTLDYTLVPSLVQASTSRAMTVSDTPLAGTLPASVTLIPSADRWEDPSGTTYQYPQRVGSPVGRTWESMVDPNLIGDVFTIGRDYSEKTKIDLSQFTLRQLEVQFSVAGFRPLEALQALTFDGQSISLASVSGSKAANAQGLLSGSFNIPAGIPTGTKAVQFTGASGSSGTSTYSGSVAIKLSIPWVVPLSSAGNKLITYVI